jgi:hypothetical protein
LQHTIKHSTLLLPALKVAHSPQVFVQYLLHFSQKLAPKMKASKKPYFSAVLRFTLSNAASARYDERTIGALAQ